MSRPLGQIVGLGLDGRLAYWIGGLEENDEFLCVCVAKDISLFGAIELPRDKMHNRGREEITKKTAVDTKKGW